MNNFLQLISEEKDGFSFGKSWRYNEDSLVALLPILRASSLKRKYLLLSETKNVEIKDTGQINKLEIENNEKRPIYIRMGELFSGSTQERMVTRSYVIMPREKTTVDVRCVHASRGISTGSTMTSSGIAPSVFDSYCCSAGFKMRNIEQRDIWKGVENLASSLNCSARILDSTSGAERYWDDAGASTTPGTDFGERITMGMEFTDDLKTNIGKFNEKVKNILKKVPYFENQVGLALVDLEGIFAIECFDLKESWRRLKQEIVKKEGEKISKQSKKSPFEYKENRAIDFLKIVLSADYEEKTLFKSKDWRIIGLKNPNYSGEIVELNDKPIHLLITRTK